MKDKEKLSAYIDNELSAHDKFNINKLIEKDERLKKEVENLKILKDAIYSLPEVQVSEDFEKKLLYKITEDKMSYQKASFWDAFLFRPNIKKIAYTVATMAFVAGATFIFFKNINNNVDNFVMEENKSTVPVILSHQGESNIAASLVKIDLLNGTFTVIKGNDEKSYAIDKMYEYFPKLVKDVSWYIKEKKNQPELANKMLAEYNISNDEENQPKIYTKPSKVIPVDNGQ